MKQEHIHLIEKYLDGELSEVQFVDLQQLVEENEEFKAELYQALEFKGLTYCSQHSQYQNLEDAVINDLAHSSDDLEDKVIAELAQEPKKPRSFSAWLIPAIAAQVILLPILYFLLQSSDVKAVEIAKITETKGFSFIVRGEQKINIKAGDILYSGDQFYVQGNSQLNLEYQDGSKLQFVDDSFVRLSEKNGRKKIELFSGQLKADVAKQKPGKQMEIITEHSSCEVLGTSFTLSSSDVSSLLDVSEGEVRFHHKKASLLVPAAHFASAGGNTLFEVQKSDKPLYKSPLITKDTAGQKVPIKVDIKDAKKLYLVVGNGGINNRFDHAAWIRPTLSGLNGTLDLTELPWIIAKAGAMRILKNKDHHGGPLSVEGKDLKVGISAHATSIIAWDIPEGYDTFEATGVLLDSGTMQRDAIPSVHFEVYTSMPELKLQKLLIRRHHY
jgi:hypothetical protein